jgi:hypothetical protein
MDGNFQAEHMRMKNPENDVPLSDTSGDPNFVPIRLNSSS